MCFYIEDDELGKEVTV